MKPRILLVEFFSRGGLLHYSWQLAQGLARQAPECEVVLLTARHAECAGAAGGVRVLEQLCTWNPQARPRIRGLGRVPRRLLRAWRGLRYVAAWVQVLGVVRRERPAVVLLGDFEHRCDAWFVRRLRRRAGRGGGRKFILADIWHNVEAFERNRPGGVVRRPRWRTGMAREFDTIFVNGRALGREFARLTGIEARSIAHGNQDWVVEQAGPDPGLRRRLGLEGATPPVALLFGSLSEYKGVGVLIEALGRVAPGLRPMVVIAGQPTAGARLGTWQAAARRLGVEAWVRWAVGYVPTEEIAWYFRLADWVVLPYVAASQSGVAHLALSLGRALIVSSAGSLAEVIAGNGLVVEAGNATELAQALAQLSADGGLRQAMGARSAELAQTRHSWDVIAASVLAGWGWSAAGGSVGEARANRAG